MLWHRKFWKRWTLEIIFNIFSCKACFIYYNLTHSQTHSRLALLQTYEYLRQLRDLRILRIFMLISCQSHGNLMGFSSEFLGNLLTISWQSHGNLIVLRSLFRFLLFFIKKVDEWWLPNIEKHSYVSALFNYWDFCFANGWVVKYKWHCYEKLSNVW